MILHIVGEVLGNALLITGLVTIMMMLIEYINVQSAGKWFAKLQGSKPRQVLLGSILGVIPGCVGGFAVISLYSHRLLSFGALIAMMICSSGDEAFVLLAMIPEDAFKLFGVLFVIGLACGLLVDRFYKGKPIALKCNTGFEVHSEHIHEEKNSIFHLSSYKKLVHPSKERIIVMAGIVLFITAIFTGLLAHEHGPGEGHGEQTVEMAQVHQQGNHGMTALDTPSHIHEQDQLQEGHHHGDGHHHGKIDILDGTWVNIVFATLSIIVLLFTATAPEHFIKEHIWHHVIMKHLIKVFLWTFGTLLVIQIGMHYMDISSWVRENTYYLIILAALVGIIPESGPHMLFVTLFATGHVPFSVLLTSSISQDGHTTLPLLASNKKSFAMAKLLNTLIAVLIGTAVHLILHS